MITVLSEWIKTNTQSPINNEILMEDEDDGSGSGIGPSVPVEDKFPIDDEDGYFKGYEGSGVEPQITPSRTGGRSYSPPIDQVAYDIEGSGRGVEDVYPEDKVRTQNRPTNNRGNTGNRAPPAATAKDKMTLSQALTIYILPAVIMFLGSIS